MDKLKQFEFLNELDLQIFFARVADDLNTLSIMSPNEFSNLLKNKNSENFLQIVKDKVSGRNVDELKRLLFTLIINNEHEVRKIPENFDDLTLEEQGNFWKGTNISKFTRDEILTNFINEIKSYFDQFCIWVDEANSSKNLSERASPSVASALPAAGHASGATNTHASSDDASAREFDNSAARSNDASAPDLFGEELSAQQINFFENSFEVSPIFSLNLLNTEVLHELAHTCSNTMEAFIYLSGDNLSKPAASRLLSAVGGFSLADLRTFQRDVMKLITNPAAKAIFSNNIKNDGFMYKAQFFLGASLEARGLGMDHTAAAFTHMAFAFIGMARVVNSSSKKAGDIFFEEPSEDRAFFAELAKDISEKQKAMASLIGPEQKAPPPKKSFSGKGAPKKKFAPKKEQPPSQPESEKKPAEKKEAPSRQKGPPQKK